MPEYSKQISLNGQDTEDMLLHQLAFHKLLGSIFARFHSILSGHFDAAIDQTLQEIGSFLQADRSYLFLLSDDKLLLTNTHEWCAAGIPAQKNNIQNLACADYNWTINELLSSEYIYISSVENMPESAQREKILLTSLQVQSLLMVPLKRKNKIYGFLGLDAITQTREWSSEDISLLTIVANILLGGKDHKLAEDFRRIALQLANSIDEAILIISQPDAIILANQAFTQITGHLNKEIIGKPHFLLDLVEPERATINDMHRLLREQGKWNGTVIGKHKDGHSYPASMFVSTNRDKDENLTRYLVILKDMTEQYKLEQERAKLKNKTVTAQKLNSLSAMSAGVVHEISQPLNAIKVLVDGMLYCHKNNYKLPQSEIFQKLGEVSTEMKRIDEIIQSIRSFACSNQSTELSSCSWNAAVEHALGLLGRQLATHQIIVSLILAENLPQMYANPARLDEVLINLLVNAMQALDTTEKAEKEIICQTLSTDKHTILEIADNACGIDESLHEMIFEPFFTNKHGSHGMGLGLSVVAAIMTSLKGQVTVFNNARGGATFRLELPIIQDHPGE